MVARFHLGQRNLWECLGMPDSSCDATVCFISRTGHKKCVFCLETLGECLNSQHGRGKVTVNCGPLFSQPGTSRLARILSSCCSVKAPGKNQAKPQKMNMSPEKGPFQRERILFQPFHFFRVNIEFSAE